MNVTEMQHEPAPTENAQLMFMPNFAAPATIYRFNNSKKGRKAYEAAVKAWRAWGGASPSKLVIRHIEIKGDMFDGWVDLDHVAAINFVEWPKRGKFVPRIV